MRATYAALLLWSASCMGMTGLEFLQAAPAPIFKAGNTLSPLTRWAWPLSVELNTELAQRWGYALDIDPGLTGEAFDSPASDASRMAAISVAQGYPVSVNTRRVMFEWAYGTSQSLLPDAAWCHLSDGSLLLEFNRFPVLKPYISDADAALMAQPEVARLVRLKASGAKVSMILNGAEYLPDVPGNDGPLWVQDPEVAAWLDGVQLLPDADKIAAFASQKAKQERAIRDAALGVIPATFVYYTNGDTLRGLVPEINRLPWTWPYRFMIEGGTIPAWQFYYSQDGTWTADAQNISMVTRATNAIAQSIEGGRPLTYNWVTAGWSLTDPSQVADDKRYMGFLKFLYTLGSVGNVAGYFSFPDGGFNGDLGATPPDWLRQIEILSHAHAAFTYLEPYLRDGDLLPGDGQHVWATDLYGQPSWPHPSYVFATSPGVQVAARKLRGRKDWLVVAWANEGVMRNVSVTIPEAGKLTLQARPEGSLYQVKANGQPKLLDLEGMSPSKTLVKLLK